MIGRRTTASIGKAKKIRFISEKIIALPTLPTIVAKMMELVDNPKTSARSLARLIKGDQVLTAKILKLANSAYYGFQREVSTVNLAIVVVGFDAVKDMGLSVSVLDNFKDPGESGYFDISKFWEHAISVGMGASMLSRQHRPEYSNDSFAAGLLHDIGKFIINQYLHEDFMEIMERVHEDDMDLLHAETVVLDTTHDRIGGWLAEKWNMPFSIVEAIEFHHNPYLAKRHQPLAALVKLADYLSRYAKFGMSGHKAEPVLADEDREIFRSMDIDISEESLQGIAEDFIVNMEQAHTFLDIIKGEERKLTDDIKQEA
jgi:HD-like signal output (HDOD) protein